jgi:hypothetical protein
MPCSMLMDPITSRRLACQDPFRLPREFAAGRCQRFPGTTTDGARDRRGSRLWHLHGGASAARIPDTVISGNDLHHLRQTYIHLFIVPLCRASEYVTLNI